MVGGLYHAKKDSFLSKAVFYLVDLKGIEPSNLTDANRALSHSVRFLPTG